ncbi:MULTISPECIES: thioredoxin [Rhizobium]|uniref:Thioredoxin n=1 Tax=Rhizobium binae TaxID=1138190 RepID=A0ABV2MS30_9HYPH|nr:MULTISPECIES: thioredoxin [Rhizobium]NKL52560.1 thioredoxin [Rhizobium leguminosarum bv. viciae]MBX4893858.1 thioredoxin [Rhizobium bangladeshense]MBX4935217.1 thioredoxin [Rhizobium bangladeshense]MBX4995776.1 thioredoxin [Rhizobium binae]MBX5155421.1 thioredoxin [Rhizobium lentis]
MFVSKVDKKNFQSEVLESEKPVLVDFWGDRCPPCKIIARVLEELAVELEGKVKFAKLNVIQNQELAAQLGVRVIPTLWIFKHGEVADKLVGARQKSDISNWSCPLKTGQDQVSV